MPRDWDIDTLRRWDEMIREKVEAFGLRCFPQEFEVCDHNQMLGYMAYHGMPSHYPHWSYGKAYEKLKTLYDYGVTGLPYEMVINSNPCLASLMRDNSLCLQILTMAHVYAHNDFFANNFTFSHTRPELTVENMKNRAERVRDYIEDPSIGLERVETVLDAAHALSMNCRRNRGIRKLSHEEQKERAMEAARPREDRYSQLEKRPEPTEPDLRKVPLEPEEDILLFIRDHSPYLEEWEKDLLTIVHEEAEYFIPQIETKIMNEGWATYWHHRIMSSLDLPQDLYLEFLVHHNQVVRPAPGSINPYHVGFRVWQDIVRRHDAPTDDEVADHGPPTKSGDEAIFEAREADRDVSFLRRFLTEKLMRELDLFEHQTKQDNRVVTRVSDEENWRAVRETLLKNVGMNSVPVIKIVDADFGQNRMLYLRHEHDGRDLELKYAERTLGYVYQLWGRKVYLETRLERNPILLTYDEDGFRRESRFRRRLR